ncbi:MAG: hypothetical protein HFJ25_03400 [Clostridia bacterium]|jgi:hypothetical protein|nr:hypothetical protein [Clostridia bacterium]
MKKFILKKNKRKDYVQFTCRIEEGLLEQIRNLVIENNLDSVNGLINDCLQFAMDNMEIKED